MVWTAAAWAASHTPESREKAASKIRGRKRLDIKPIDLVGQIFGKWTVVKATTRRAKNGGAYWICRCECGAEREVTADSLKLRKSQGCGCHPRKTCCLNGHEYKLWGKTPSGACRACVKNKSLLRNYGITLEDFLSLGKLQNWKCAICGRALEFSAPQMQGWGRGARVEVDHRHQKTTDKRLTVRGLLCGGRWAGCNRKLGKVDSPAWLQKALEYVSNPPAQILLAVPSASTKAVQGPTGKDSGRNV